ncbi:glutamate--cysteine ligase [Shinella oryzae]|uniref:Glutamate--cysteine ligase n=1 Tax=Shinella oryzae TaxID=2871820 RepID=A0ABY9K0L4_9HYPH|nr:glutamate--cysteine ligase [Shinella oryzae]WLS01485.1 glutamate--cysteine ligase [Shinella oryzae]
MARDTSDHTPIGSIGDLIDHLATGCKPEANFRVGTEHEKFAFFRDSHAPVPYFGEASISALLNGMRDAQGWGSIMDGENIIGLAEPYGMGAISIEPGGQFELSGAPLQNLHQTYEETREHLTILKTIAEPLGIRFLGLGGSPKWSFEETPRMPKSRYAIMTRYMPKVGRHGLDMMYRTSTIQVNLDFSSENDMRRKMQVSMKLQSLATALFASSPFTEGKPNGYLSWRGEIWRDTDNARAGLLPFVFKPDFGFADYVNWALDVPMYFVVRDGKYHDCTHINFRQALDGALKSEIADWQPNMGDWANHLSTLFPDVRLKRFLEMRGADGGPLSRILALPAFWVGLLYDAEALSAAETLTRDWSCDEVRALRDAVPVQGLNAPFRGGKLIDIAQDVLRISRLGLRNRAQKNVGGEDEDVFLAPLDEMLVKGTTLAEDLLAQYRGPWGGSGDPVFSAFQF